MVTLRELRRGRRPKRVRAPAPLTRPGASEAEEEVDGEHSDAASSCESSRHHHHHHTHHRHHHDFHPNLHPYVNVVNTFPALAPCAYRYWSDMPCAVSSYEVVYRPPPPPRYMYPPPYGPYYAGPPPYVATCPAACPTYTCAPRC